MDGGLAGSTGNGDDAPERASSAQASAPPSPGAEAPSGRSGPAAQQPPLVSRARAFWEGTAPLRQRLGKFLRSVIDALRESAPISGTTSPAPAGPLTERLDTLAPIRVSGQGRAFNFHIYARCLWSSENLRRDALQSYAHYYMEDAVRRLTRLAAQHAGSFAASRAPELEVQLQRALTESGPWRYERGDKVVTCQPHVWVGVDERVRKVVLPYWEKLVKLDCEFDVDQRQAEYDNRLGRQRPAGADNRTNGATPGDAVPTSSEDRDSELRQLVADLRAFAQRLDGLLDGTPRDAETS